MLSTNSIRQFIFKSSENKRHTFRPRQRVTVHKQYEDCLGRVVAVHPNAVIVEYWSEFYRGYRIGSFYPQFVSKGWQS